MIGDVSTAMKDPELTGLKQVVNTMKLKLKSPFNKEQVRALRITNMMSGTGCSKKLGQMVDYGLIKASELSGDTRCHYEFID